MSEIIKDSAAEMIRINASNASFSMKNGFLCLTMDKDGETVSHNRVFLHRDFPFEKLWEYISVLDGDSKEIGIIINIADFDEDTRALLRTELERKYYCPEVKVIESLKERYGFSYWTVITAEDRKVSFTMQDTFRNIIRVGQDKCLLLDVDGNRFIIESVAALDRKSHKKIEIYL
ncbi:MAG: DUF1854 domain-containing protein [Clostridia bacterium]|nr:DUF1854 domain-containing protein [Clostridia bacterium]